jgi:hypothetical protein
MSSPSAILAGNDTIDRYPPACEKVEKILCVSEKIFKKIVKDFEAFFKDIKSRPKQKSLNLGPNKAQIKAPKKVNTAQKATTLPYGLMNKPSQFEPSNGLDSLSRTYRHRVGRLNDWYDTYGQGMYE